MLSEEVRRKIIEGKESYPDRRSAIMPALYAVQESEGHISEDAMAEVAKLLEIPASDVGGVASFYSMYFRKPVGRYVLDVCKTLSCSLLGAEHLVEHLSKKLGIKVGETTPDGMFTLRTVECLGDCGNAPVMMVGDTYYENLTPEKLDSLLDELRAKARE